MVKNEQLHLLLTGSLDYFNDCLIQRNSFQWPFEWNSSTQVFQYQCSIFWISILLNQWQFFFPMPNLPSLKNSLNNDLIILLKIPIFLAKFIFEQCVDIFQKCVFLWNSENISLWHNMASRFGFKIILHNSNCIIGYCMQCWNIFVYFNNLSI